MNAEEGDKNSQTVAFIGISSGNHGDHEYQQLSMEDRLVDKVSSNYFTTDYGFLHCFNPLRDKGTLCNITLANFG